MEIYVGWQIEQITYLYFAILKCSQLKVEYRELFSSIPFSNVGRFLFSQIRLKIYTLIRMYFVGS